MTTEQEITDKLDEIHEQLDEIKDQTRQIRRISRIAHPGLYKMILDTVAEENNQDKAECPECTATNLVDPDHDGAVQCWHCLAEFSPQQAAAGGGE